MGCQQLYSAVVSISHEQSASAVEANASRKAELTFATAVRAKFAKELAIRSENLVEMMVNELESNSVPECGDGVKRTQTARHSEKVQHHAAR